LHSDNASAPGLFHTVANFYAASFGSDRRRPTAIKRMASLAARRKSFSASRIASSSVHGRLRIDANQPSLLWTAFGPVIRLLQKIHAI
jgi:hypothetical protein